jgi:DNA (cytosine-5)-methyltransferase 1
MSAYFNENDKHAASWLRELIKRKLIADGVVDERSICDVQGSDLKGFSQCHFFAGIGGWSYALRLAGWPDDRPVWTGSCPCQPFSLNGKNEGTNDSRDLWPVFGRLIADQKPAIVFGEQVAAAIRWGWLDRMCDNLEAICYAIGSAVLPATSVEAKHERERLWWFASLANASTFNGNTRHRVVSSRTRRTSPQPRGLSGLHVAGRWWAENERGERMPALVRNFDGLPTILGGFGNAIVPQVAAAFIEASEEAMKERA